MSMEKVAALTETCFDIISTVAGFQDIDSLTQACSPITNVHRSQML